MTAIDWILAVSVVALVMMTAIYAWQTYVMTRAAKEQAAASMKIAEDMKEQTRVLRDTVSASVRPLLDARVVQMRRGENKFSPPREIDIEIQNSGKGAARNIEITCNCSAMDAEYTEAQLPVLEAGNGWQVSLDRVSKHQENGDKAFFLLISVMYNDELGELWSTTVRIVRENGGWRPEVTTLNRM